jgi:hypothetical protein
MSPQMRENCIALIIEHRNEPVHKRIDAFKSDVFSLGLTLLEAMTLKQVTGLNLLKNRKRLEKRIDSVTKIYGQPFT